jgi:uncharacterized protein
LLLEVNINPKTGASWATGAENPSGYTQPPPAGIISASHLLCARGTRVRYAGVTVFILVLCFGVACRPHQVSQLAVDAPLMPIVADGESRISLRVRAEDGRVLNQSDIYAKILEQDGHGRIAGIVSKGSGEPMLIEFVPGVNPGRLTIELRGAAFRNSRVALTTALANGDYYQDGTPDFLRLTAPQDRAAFRYWFTLLAERQALSGVKLPSEINDCAALLRYAYRQSMRRHDSTWASDSNLGALPTSSDIAKYSYPYTPLGPSLFRTKQGTFVPADLTDGTFSEFADARTLIVANAHLLTRDVRLAQPGDLLFFRQFEQNSPFHSMIFIGRSHFGEGNEWLVYHTGPDGKWPGEIRRVSLTSLLAHPNARWRPEISNPNFLGVYRWNILREAK